MDEHEIMAAVLAGPDAIIAADPAGLIVYWNPAAERIFGYSTADAVGRLVGSDHPGAAAGPALAGLASR